MTDTTNKPDKQLYVATTGNAVLFTNTDLPSPLDLSSSEDNHPVTALLSALQISSRIPQK